MDNRGKGHQDFLSKLFCLTVPKIFVEPFCDVFQNFFCSEKFMDKRGKGHQDFLSKLFCLTGPKIFVEEPFCDVFQKISGSEKAYG